MSHEVSSPPLAQSSPVHVQSPPPLTLTHDHHKNPRAEIDTSAPFESVKEAVTRFGGIGFWKPSHKLNDSEPTEQDDESINVLKMEEQTLLLEKDLMAREKETLDVLKELESTKNILEQLKLKLQTEMAESEKENQNPTCPEFILVELKQAKLNLTRTTAEIEQTRAKIKTAKIRLVAAKKMKDAARAAEAVAIAEIKAISTTENNPDVTLSYDEYLLLTSKARESEEAVNVLEKEKVSQMEILKRVEEATEEVKSSKRVLEEALNRVEAANAAKFDVEESLKKWKSDHHNHSHSQRRQNTKSKNLSDPGMNLVNDETRPSLSIGQILSRKLLLKEEYEKGYVKKKVSLGQMLCKPATGNGMKQQQLPTKRKNVSRFARLSVLVSKQNKTKKKKKTTSS